MRDQAFDIAKNPKYDGYQRGLASVVYKFGGGGVAMLANKSAVKNENMQNKELAEELQKPKFENSRKENYNHFL